MLLVPALTPVATPIALTVATDVLLLLHERVFAFVFVREVILPSHTDNAPVNTGLPFTVTTADTPQPLAVYTMMAVPAARPVTVPLAASTVPVTMFRLLQVPPAGVLFSVVVLFTHTVLVPVITVGEACTVVTCIAVQPLLLYVMLAVPTATPLTTPVLLFTVATAGVLLLHVPPGTDVPSGKVALRHTDVPPVIEPMGVPTVAVNALAQPVRAV
jgi:hypothetical protein